MRLFEVLAHPQRLRILNELRHDDACVCHLQHVLEKPQVYVSQQLRVLKAAGVVSDEKHGQHVYYRLTDPLLRQLLELALGPLQATRLACPGCSCPECRGEHTHVAGKQSVLEANP